MATPSPWPQRISTFSLSPSQFLSSTTSECFLAELLCDLRDDKASESIKILLLSLLQEYPNVLCPSSTVGEETVLDLLAIFNQALPRSINLKCHLMLAITNVLVCTSCLDSQGNAAECFLDLLFQTVQDTNDLKDGQAFRSLRAVACDCLREVETCFPGLFSRKLEALYLLKQQEMTPLHQAYCILYTLSLKNAIHLLSQGNGVADGELKSLLTANEGLAWKAVEKPLPPFPVSSMSQIPVLQANTDIRELRSIVSLLLEESYLLTPVSQAALLRELVEVVAMVQALSPAIFKSQLLRLFGTTEVTLMHATLLMKATFTDSLFTTEDENFFIKRLVGMAQHPLLSSQQKLFYMDCILHFPENRPISSNGEESLPVLVTPRLAASLLPTVFNNSSTMLCRLSLLSLVYMEDDDDKGVSYLFDHLMALHRIVDNHATREMTVTFFRAAFTFLNYFYHSEKFTSDLTARLCKLYSRHCYLAPNLNNLIDRAQECLGESGWPIQLLKALQKLIVELPLPQLTLQNLSWHLKVLGRVARESQVPQRSSLCFLLSVLVNSSLCSAGGWRLGNAVLAVCRNLLLHPSLDQVFIELADLLQHVMLHYEDTDIQDHARFYYTLLTNLSREKLSGIMTKGPDIGPTKVRSLSSIMAESDGQSSCLTVHQTKRTVLQLVKVLHNEAWEAPGKGESESPEDKEVLKVYREQFLSPGFASEVNLRCHLKHVGEVDAFYHKLFSICLHFELTDSNYEEVKDITVPCLFKDRKPPVVHLKLKPRQPYPTRLRTSAMFATEDGLSWYTQLEDVFVSFPDVFLPLPVKVDWSQESREQLFDQIWRCTCSEECSLSATSLFCFELGERSLRGLVDLNFHPYLICKNQDQERYKVLFFLPPQCHVLLNITITEDAVHISIATDNWKLLPYINSYLQNVTSETQIHAESLVEVHDARIEDASREM
ncbi:hypothetical protein SKAU_G00170860 [Synaphobranchus kaupii]|uniref:AP-5 complex subunit beta-1 n=1 Tax=Synaphobranchus kaupii TaxID=118154 RepID=A0A9Q1FKJ7_SYNKA|nr:hypothetical protein SKAU_G00170860 [Synaphobranchus kaupii]